MTGLIICSTVSQKQTSRLCEDDWALPEMSSVVGMLGAAAIYPLTAYLNAPEHKEFARAMALDGLAEIVKQLLIEAANRVSDENPAIVPH